jgi:hypothetical protein
LFQSFQTFQQFQSLKSDFSDRVVILSDLDVVCGASEFAKEAGGLPNVIPAKAGMQKHLIFVDSGSR